MTTSSTTAPMPDIPTVGSAIDYAWRVFQAQWKTLVTIFAIPAVLYLGGLVALIVAQFSWLASDAALPRLPDGSLPDPEPPVTFLVLLGVVYVGTLIGVFLMQAWAPRLGIDLVSGRRVRVGSFCTLHVLGRPLLAASVYLLGIVAGTLLCVLPGLIFAIGGRYLVLLVIDRRLGIGQAITVSFRLVRTNLGPVLLFILVGYGITLAGQAVPYVGLVAAAPIAVVLQTHLYRFLIARDDVLCRPGRRAEVAPGR